MKHSLLFDIRISLIVLITMKIVKCETSNEDNSQSSAEGISISRVVDMILNKSRRALTSQHGAQMKKLHSKLRQRAQHLKQNKVLRSQDMVMDPTDMMDTQAKLIESELKNALSHKKSALFDKPFVEKQGRNDFLVIQPDHKDPFVTVIPNAIYYNIEKRCVNWLDDCNLQGIRARLLRGAKSPYKK